MAAADLLTSNLIHDRYVGPWVQSISIHDLGHVYK